MRKQFLFAAASLLIMGLGFVSCEGKQSGGQGGGEEQGAEATKEQLYNTANDVIAKFNTADQQEAVELADGITEKFEDFDFGDLAEQFGDKYQDLFELPRYARAVLTGNTNPTSIDHIYTFSFENECGEFVADEVNKTWNYIGKTNDNSIILRCNDRKGIACVAKIWGEGVNQNLDFEDTYMRTEYPKIYIEDESQLTIYGYAKINGKSTMVFFSQGTGNWYYVNSNGTTITLSYAPTLTSRYAYDENDHYCYYDKKSGRYYYKDWDNPYEVAHHYHISGIVPRNIYFTLTQGNNEMIRIESTQDLQMNDHANFAMKVRIANLSWTVDLNCSTTAASFASKFMYGNEYLYSATGAIPSYQLILKDDTMSYEDWAVQYDKRYDEVLRNIGGGNCALDLAQKIQFRANMTSFGNAYAEIKQMYDRSRDTEDFWNSREYAQTWCDVVNKYQTNGIYFNSDVKQAEMRMQLSLEEYNRYLGYDSDTGENLYEKAWRYRAEPVLYFPQDGTTYGFEQYFNRKPFRDVSQSVENMVNSYLRLANFLSNQTEGGEIHFGFNEE